MLESRLPLNVKTKDEMLSEGLQRYVARDFEHPSARFYVSEDIRQQRAYEAARLEQQARDRELGNLALQPSLELELEPMSA